MAITYLSTNKSQINTIIDSQNFKDYIEIVQAYLHLDNRNYIIEVSNELPTDAEGYVKEYTNASTDIANNKIIVYPEIIVKNINNKFSKFTFAYENIFEKIVLLFIQFVYAHELAHLKQIEDGRLSKQIIEEYKNTYYYKRPYEIDANESAQKILNKYGKFEMMVIESILLNIPNNNLPIQLKELYSN